ncbi:MAG: hypothetical protein JNJ65_08895 [Cyclobacteriaceae bacterium]|nr:hypothetical protein [Cyclobacteriaceae bacterium]
MEVDRSSKICPICGYEFATYSSSMKWIALILALLLLLLWIF